MKPNVTLMAAMLALGVGLSVPTHAQALVDGQVTKIDRSAEKITIKHGPIKKFDMDGMSMVFRVQDPAMLKQVNAGDKVQFDVDKINGQFTIIKIQKAK
jgi:Cu(I)/Ag(I) efflux system periplasmic protein CusF